eukprot:scaffold10931_cov75-Phaeocystis_antarctica.AAC.2
MSRLDGVVLRLRRGRCVRQRLLEAADLRRGGGWGWGRDKGCAAAAKGVADLVSSRQVSQHGLERLGRARRVRLLVPPKLARVTAYLDRHVHPIVGEQRRLECAPQRRDEDSLRAEATNRTLPCRGLHPAQLGQRRVGHIAPRRIGLRLPVPKEEDTARPAAATTAATGLRHGCIPDFFLGRL